MSDRVAILGTGKMGEALLSGMVRAGRPLDGLVVTTHDDGRADVLRERYGVEVTDNASAVKSASTIVIAVKPQDMGTLLDEIAALVSVGPAAGLCRRRHHDVVHRAPGSRRRSRSSG